MDHLHAHSSSVKIQIVKHLTKICIKSYQQTMCLEIYEVKKGKVIPVLCHADVGGE
jgi:hypothetical protein